MEVVYSGILADLPHYLTPFIGRQQELAEIRRLLVTRRLLTLTGAGGSGKTRLALAAAAELTDQFLDGVCLVELAALSDPELVVPAVAAALGLREQPESSWETVLVRWLRPQKFLLLLDNCEHLLAPAATLTDNLLRACPRLTILTTSREPLAVMGEQVWPVPPLSIPLPADPHLPETLLAYDAVALFVERAQAAAPGFSLTGANAPIIAALCQKLDGIPLAIELAAARVRSLSVSQILPRLDHSLSLLTSGSHTTLPRQQTMYAAIDWSYQLLDHDEALLFRRLATFVGGFTLTAVEAICGPQENLLEIVTSLINKSLVIVIAREPEAQYRLLEPVRHFAWHLLQTSGELDNLRQKHADYYLSLAEAAEPYLYSSDRPQWLERLQAEHDNLRHALNWLEESEQLGLAMRLITALIWYYYFIGRLSSFLRQSRTILAWASQTELVDQSVQARLAWGVGAVTWMLGEYQESLDILQQAERWARQAAALRPLAYTLTLLGLVAQLVDDAADSLPLHAESVRLFQKIGDSWGEALALYWWGDTLRLRREHAAAFQYYEQSRVIFGRLGDPWGMALPLQGLGSVAYRQDDLPAAHAWLQEGLALRRLSGDRWLLAQTLCTLAMVETAQGDAAAAKTYLQEAITLYQAIGDSYGMMYGLFQLGELEQAVGHRAAAETAYRACLAQAQAAGHARRIDQCQTALAALTETVAAKPHPALELFALGHTRVMRNGYPVNWPYARVRELLFYLLDQGPRRKGQIGLDLWPEADPAHLRHYLHDALYHARKALANSAWLIYADKHYAFNPTLPYRYDVADFLACLAPAARSQEERIEQLRQAVGLYQGDFLDEFDSEWCYLRREDLHRRFLGALLELGQLLAGAGQYAAAIDIYHQAAQQDPLLEEAHRGLIRCYLQSGQPAAAAQQYHHLAQLLAAELGISPAPETTALLPHLH